MSKARVIHVINSFEFGGAESMLCDLLLRTDRDRFEPSVVSLIDDLTVAGPILKAKIPLVTMGMKPGVPNPAVMPKLIRHLRRERPGIVQTWMDHSNLIGGVAARFVPRAKVVWGIHHASHLPGISKRSTLWTVDACAKLSCCVPSKIILCSEQSRILYGQRGFAERKLIVIPNGFDTERFCPDPIARAELRREIGVPEGALLVGLAARYDPIKDHANFVRAAAKVAESRPEVRFLLCGFNIDGRNAELMAWVRDMGLVERCHLIGPRRDVQRVYAALDVSVSSSIAEAFPLAIGEAMACGVPCAATDVGDSALIVGDAGRVVPARDPTALAAAIRELLDMPPEARAALGRAARERVKTLFDLTAVTRRYEAVYESLLATGA